VNDLFVTGTGTGVGKTVVVAAICSNTGALPMKPLQTGAMTDDDLAFVARVTGRPAPPPVYVFDEPLAPKVAAERAGVTIDVGEIARAYERLRERDGHVVVEGAGGLLVEIAEGVTMADLAHRLELPVVVVCRPGLGTLNHTALTVEAARARGLGVLGVVVSGWPKDPDVATRTNPNELRRIAPLLGVIPHIDGLDTTKGEPAVLPEVAEASLAPPLGGTFDAAEFLAKL
jgi:dethiobiotin synthetase